MHSFFRKLSWLIRRRHKEAELREELEFHLTEETEERKAVGLADVDARFAARRDLGNVVLVAEDTRAVWGWPVFEQFAQDVKYAVRTLLRNPGFTAAAIAPIALGIGVNTGIVSILDSIALQSLRVPYGAELISLNQRIRGIQRHINGAPSMFSVPEYQTYRDRAQTLSGLMGYSRPWNVTLGGQMPRQVEGELVTCNYFDVLQLKPVIGAGFTTANCEAPRGPAPVVLSHDLWTTVFGADPGILSKNVTLNRQPFAVVGVAPKRFHGVGLVRSTFFAPVSTLATLRADQKNHLDPNVSWLSLVGRRKADVALEQVRAEMAVIARHIDQQQPGRTTTVAADHATVLSLPQARRDILRVATVILAAFGLVLLIASANVANLMLARAAGRTKEIAVRLSVGATRRRLIRQLLTESLIIALIGGAAGSLLAWWSFQALLVVIVSSLPGVVPMPNVDVQPSMMLLWFALGLTVTTAVAFGLVPALQASKPDVQSALKLDSASSARKTGGWLGGTLIAAQVAVCTLLLISASLLVRALYAAHVVEPGFDYHNVTTMSFDLRGARYDETNAQTFQQQLRERVVALPGVIAVAQVDRTPLSPGRTGTMMRLPGLQQSHEIDLATVSPDYFDLIGIPIVRGRTFTATELTETSHAIVVTEATARRYWPTQDPVGQTILMYDSPKKEIPRHVVGVAKDAQVARIAEIESSYAYLPAGPQSQRGLSLLVRSQEDFAAVAPRLRAVAGEVDADLVVRIVPLEENLDFWRSLSRLIASISGSLSVLALVLALVGVYGVVSYVVGRRLREVGIRVMLGASAHEIRVMILRQTLRPVVVGLAIGIVAAAVATQILKSVLFGVSALDPIAFAAAPLFLLGVATAASLPSIRRAARLDPMILRYE